MYNLLFGENSHSEFLLKILGFNQSDIPRYRDCFLQDNAIVIYTRTGGGNRDFYENEETCRSCYPEDFEEENPPSGPWNDDLRKNPNFISDCDEDFDCTYANFYFKFPEEFRDDLEALANKTTNYTPSQKWKMLFEAMEKKND
jgi:hypothetical protein